VGVGLGADVAVGSRVGSEQGSAQQGRYGGMHTQVPQQQLHSFPTGQLCANGLHSLTLGIGVGVVATCVADADNARLSAVTNTHVVRSVGIGACDFYCGGSTDCQC
jgi:fluoride ion exporter CrcB/FEX